jgi:hypothetical protein
MRGTLAPCAPAAFDSAPAAMILMHAKAKADEEEAE